jgi:hypothetical protein
VDFGKAEGPKCKTSEIRISRNYFPKGNPWTESTSPWTASGAGPRWTTVEGKWRGDGGEPHRWQERAAEGRTQPGDGGEQSAEETLGGGGLRTRKHAIEGEVSLVMAGGAPRPFIVAEGGTPRRGRGKRPAVMALMPLMAGRLDEGLRSEIKEGNQGME